MRRITAFRPPTKLSGTAHWHPHCDCKADLRRIVSGPDGLTSHDGAEPELGILDIVYACFALCSDDNLLTTMLPYSKMRCVGFCDDGFSCS